jgi:beta-glucanase (GH16 family)
MTHHRAATARLAMAALVLAGCSSAQGDGGVQPQPTTPQVLFSEDFAGAQVDRSRWTVEVWGGSVNDEQQAYVDSASTLYIARGAEVEGAQDGTALVIHPRWRPGFVTHEGRRFDFISGRIITRDHFQFTYGTAAARIKMPPGSGLWPAFWLLGAGDWPDTGEIDVMEYVGERGWTSQALHGPGYSGDTPLANRSPFPAGQDATDWHVYSVVWGMDSIVFFVDDRVVYTVTRPMVERYGRWSFSNPKFIILNFALGGGYPAGVNGTRAPYFGLPEQSVRMVQADSARFLVDWVRVTR